MKCKKYETMASAYIDRQMNKGEIVQYRAHLSMCADCRAYLTQIRQTSLMLREVEAPAPPRELRSYIMTAVRRRAEKDVGIRQQALEWLIRLNPLPLSYATGAIVSVVLFALVLVGLKPIPVIGSTDEQFVVFPVVTGTDREYHVYNNLRPDASLNVDEHNGYQLPRVLNNGSLVSFSHIAYRKPGPEGMSAMVEISPDGRAKLVDVLEEPNDPYLIEQLWWSLSQRTFQPAIVDGRAVPTRIVLIVEKVDVQG